MHLRVSKQSVLIAKCASHDLEDFTFTTVEIQLIILNLALTATTLDLT